MIDENLENQVAPPSPEVEELVPAILSTFNGIAIIDPGAKFGLLDRLLHFHTYSPWGDPNDLAVQQRRCYTCGRIQGRHSWLS